MFLQAGDSGLDDRLDATGPVAAVRVAPGDGITHPEQRVLVRSDVPVLHLRKSSSADCVRDQSAVSALEGLVSFDDQLRHASADCLLSECAEGKGPEEVATT